MVVAAAEADLLVRGVDAGADRRRLAEVEGRSRDGPQLARGDERRVDGREGVGLELQLVSRIVPSPSPARLKYAWFVRLRTVGASVVAE